MMGPGSLNHNCRKFHAANTDPARSHLNIEYCNEDIKTVYQENASGSIRNIEKSNRNYRGIIPNCNM